MSIRQFLLVCQVPHRWTPPVSARRVLSGNWQPNDECGALTLRALDLNCSATLLDDLARSCKTDARAWNASRDFAGTPKTLEDSRDFTSWNAESVIFHLQDRPLTSVQVLPVGTHDISPPCGLYFKAFVSRF